MARTRGSAQGRVVVVVLLLFRLPLMAWAFIPRCASRNGNVLRTLSLSVSGTLYESKDIRAERSKVRLSSSRGQRTQEDASPEDDIDKPRLLPKRHPDDHGKKCLVLDMDQTLSHSSYYGLARADFVIAVKIGQNVDHWDVVKRPGVDEFLLEMAKNYELVVYTAGTSAYANQLLDVLDPKRVIRARLFRESCVFHEGDYVKDLSLLDRDLSQTIIVDNSPKAYIFPSRECHWLFGLRGRPK